MSSQPTSAQYATGILILYFAMGKVHGQEIAIRSKLPQPLTCPYQTEKNPLARAKTYPRHLT